MIKFAAVPDAELWQMRAPTARKLVEYVRQASGAADLAADGTADETMRSSSIFDPDTLTIGFARRFATYKRPNLLLHDPERLLESLPIRSARCS